MTWLPVVSGNSPPETPASIAGELLAKAARPNRKWVDEALPLAAAGREAIRKAISEGGDVELLIRASLKLRRILSSTTIWCIVALLPLSLVILGSPFLTPRPNPSSLGMEAVAIWVIHLVVIAIVLMVRVQDAPQGRDFLPFRAMSVAVVMSAFLASRIPLAVVLAKLSEQSWIQLMLGVVVLAIIIGIATMIRAWVMHPLRSVTLSDAEREALAGWCGSERIAPPRSGSLTPTLLFGREGSWPWWKLALIAGWLAVTGGAIALQKYDTALDVAFLGLMVLLMGSLSYITGFNVLARINPYDRPRGVPATLIGFVLLMGTTFLVGFVMSRTTPQVPPIIAPAVPN